LVEIGIGHSKLVAETTWPTTLEQCVALCLV